MLTFPKRITQGVTVKCEDISLSDYPATDWTLRYIFVIAAEQTVVDAVADGDNYDLTLSKTVTAAMDAGTQFWQAYVFDASERFKVGEGETEVVTDFELQDSGFDARSELRQQTEAIRALLMGVATSEQKRVKYDGREIEKYDRTELITVYNFLKKELRIEDQAAQGANGQTFGGRVRVRM